MDRNLSKPRQVSQPLIELMRILLLPRSQVPGYRHFPTTIPRLLNIVVPGFDRYLHDHHPDFHRPATLLLTMSVRIPVLAGVFIVATQPSYWAERLLSSADRRDWKRLMACFRTLTTPGSVSYTHLDVYKRQLPILFYRLAFDLAPGHGGNPLGESCAGSSDLSDGFTVALQPH